MSGGLKLLIVLGCALVFSSVAVPWFRYVTSDGGRIGPFALVVGVGGGFLLTGLLLLFIVGIGVYHLSECDH